MPCNRRVTKSNWLEPVLGTFGPSMTDNFYLIVFREEHYPPTQDASLYGLSWWPFTFLSLHSPSMTSFTYFHISFYTPPMFPFSNNLKPKPSRHPIYWICASLLGGQRLTYIGCLPQRLSTSIFCLLGWFGWFGFWFRLIFLDRRFNSARLAGSKPQESFCLYLPSSKLRQWHHASLLYECQGQTQTLVLLQEAPYCLCQLHSP